MLNEKPVISNQHGALAMAFLPYFYAVIQAKEYNWSLLLFGIAWLFLYLFSYPFFMLFSKKPTAKNKRWAVIYFILSLGFASPVLLSQPLVLLFALPLLPLGLVQFYFAKQRNERHLLNDIAGILTFGVVGMATYYLSMQAVDFVFLIHPTLFFIATTFYIKSLARERKKPLYAELSIGMHLGLSLIYLFTNENAIFTAYLFALARAIIVPTLGWNVKKVGMFEFLTILIFLAALSY